MSEKLELQPVQQSGTDQQQQLPLVLQHPAHPLPAVFETAHQGSFEHVPALDDAQFELHTCCTQLANCQRHTQNNEKCIQIEDPAIGIHSYDRDNEPLFCLWFPLALYLILLVA